MRKSLFNLRGLLFLLIFFFNFTSMKQMQRLLLKKCHMWFYLPTSQEAVIRNSLSGSWTQTFGILTVMPKGGKKINEKSCENQNRFQQNVSKVWQQYCSLNLMKSRPQDYLIGPKIEQSSHFFPPSSLLSLSVSLFLSLTHTHTPDLVAGDI